MRVGYLDPVIVRFDLCHFVSSVKACRINGVFIEISESFLRFLILIFVFLSVQMASAEVVLRVSEKLRARAKPRVKSRVVRILQPGDELVHTGRRGRGFIELEDEIGRRLYVRRRDMLKSRLVKARDPSKAPRRNFGLNLTFSSQSQSGRELQTGTDTTYDVGDFTGSSFFFGFHLDWPLVNQWVGRLGLGMREVSMEGDATLQDSMSGSTSGFLLEQSFVSFSATMLRRFESSKYYILGEVEFAQGSDVNLEVVSGTPVDTSDVETPFYVVFSAGLGRHFNVGEKFILSPEIRLGVVSTADPFILLGELRVHGGYAF